jgi:DNA-binding transcriptional ArsR family regulator
MVEQQILKLDAIFHALGDATRRQMLRALAQGERTVTQLAEPFEMSLAAASKHIKSLEGAGLIRREVQGRIHICRLEASPLASASDWLRFYEQFWNARLDVLEGLLRGSDEQPTNAKPKGQSSCLQSNGKKTRTARSRRRQH